MVLSKENLVDMLQNAQHHVSLAPGALHRQADLACAPRALHHQTEAFTPMTVIACHSLVVHQAEEALQAKEQKTFLESQTQVRTRRVAEREVQHGALLDTALATTLVLVGVHMMTAKARPKAHSTAGCTWSCPIQSTKRLAAGAQGQQGAVQAHQLAATAKVLGGAMCPKIHLACQDLPSQHMSPAQAQG